MKITDQSQLELLYEQISDQPLRLIQQEKEYFNKVADQLTDHITQKSKNLLRFSNNKFFKEDKKTLSNFDRLLWIEPLANFTDKRGNIEFIINKTYKEWIVGSLLSLMIVREVPSPNFSSELAIEFKKADTIKEKGTVIKVANKEAMKREIFKLLCENLESFYQYLKVDKRLSEQNLWFEWREEQNKFQALKDKLPELEGIF
jgi:hypothetical protein